MHFYYRELSLSSQLCGQLPNPSPPLSSSLLNTLFTTVHSLLRLFFLTLIETARDPAVPYRPFSSLSFRVCARAHSNSLVTPC